MTTWWEFWATWLTAVGTVGATMVALYLAVREEFRQRRLRPKIAIGLRFCEPDCALVTTRADPVRPSTVGPVLVPAYWFRAFVENTGRSVARDLEILIHDVLRRDGDSWTPVSDFIASNLSWTHQRADVVYLPLLLPGTSKNFEVGCILRPGAAAIGPPSRVSLPECIARPTCFEFQLTVKPTYSYNILRPGEYEFSVTAGAANAEPVHQRFRLLLTGNWHDACEDMFRHCVRLELLAEA